MIRNQKSRFAVCLGHCAHEARQIARSRRVLEYFEGQQFAAEPVENSGDIVPHTCILEGGHVQMPGAVDFYRTQNF